MEQATERQWEHTSSQRIEEIPVHSVLARVLLQGRPSEQELSQLFKQGGIHSTNTQPSLADSHMQPDLIVDGLVREQPRRADHQQRQHRPENLGHCERKQMSDIRAKSSQITAGNEQLAVCIRKESATQGTGKAGSYGAIAAWPAAARRPLQPIQKPRPRPGRCALAPR